MNQNDPSLSRADSSGWTLIFLAWLVAMASTLGALFFSEVMHVPPCVLCWYQRIGMFPLALLLPMGLFPFDRLVVRYALPLAIAGWLVAGFHMLLIAGLIPESIRPCTQGVPCTDQPLVWFGFITIPLLSLCAFTAIIGLLVATNSRGSK